MNVAKRTLFIADNLPIMRGIDSETIDLIYLREQECLLQRLKELEQERQKRLANLHTIT